MEIKTLISVLVDSLTILKRSGKKYETKEILWTIVGGKHANDNKEWNPNEQFIY